MVELGVVDWRYGKTDCPELDFRAAPKERSSGPEKFN
jgi:hypothetical protein